MHSENSVFLPFTLLPVTCLNNLQTTSCKYRGPSRYFSRDLLVLPFMKRNMILLISLFLKCSFTKQSHSVGMAVFQPSVLRCELHDHTSKTLLINWKHSNTQGNSVITVRKTRVPFVDLASFCSFSESF